MIMEGFCVDVGMVADIRDVFMGYVCDDVGMVDHASQTPKRPPSKSGKHKHFAEMGPKTQTFC
jgi:hypothetical protein